MLANKIANKITKNIIFPNKIANKIENEILFANKTANSLLFIFVMTLDDFI